MALTVKELENAKPKTKKYKMLDVDGLSLLVLPTGTKLWLWRYQFNAGEKNMTFGEYPVVGPKEARELHFAAKKLSSPASSSFARAGPISTTCICRSRILETKYLRPLTLSYTARDTSGRRCGSPRPLGQTPASV